MEIKFYLENGREVKLGDYVAETSFEPIPTGYIFKERKFPLTPKLLNRYIDCGKIIKKEIPSLDEKTIKEAPKVNKEEVKETPKEEVPMYLQYYLQILASKHDCSMAFLHAYLTAVASFSRMAVLNIILREIAIVIDKKYSDHIENSPEIYGISNCNGKIVKLNKAHIRSYKNFAAFRSIDDARIACKIVSPLLREIFSNGKKRKKATSK